MPNQSIKPSEDNASPQPCPNCDIPQAQRQILKRHSSDAGPCEPFGSHGEILKCPRNHSITDKNKYGAGRPPGKRDSTPSVKRSIAQAKRQEKMKELGFKQSGGRPKKIIMET